MPQTKYTVKVLKTFRGREGEGFNATLLRDGVPVADVDDEASGGGFHYNWRDWNKTPRTFERDFRAFIDALPPEKIGADAPEWEKSLYPNGERKVEADCFIDDLVNEYQIAKSIKRACSKKICFVLKTHKKGEYGTFKVVFSPAAKAQILQKYPDAQILNEHADNPAKLMELLKLG
jgi:hypothetical protein